MVEVLKMDGRNLKLRCLDFFLHMALQTVQCKEPKLVCAVFSSYCWIILYGVCLGRKCFYFFYRFRSAAIHHFTCINFFALRLSHFLILKESPPPLFFSGGATARRLIFLLPRVWTRPQCVLAHTNLQRMPFYLLYHGALGLLAALF